MKKTNLIPEYIIDLIWDDDAAFWTATSEDIPGLVLESDSVDALIERVRFAAPELLDLNGTNKKTLSMCFRSERYEVDRKIKSRHTANEILKQSGIEHRF